MFFRPRLSIPLYISFLTQLYSSRPLDSTCPAKMGRSGRASPRIHGTHTPCSGILHHHLRPGDIPFEPLLGFLTTKVSRYSQSSAFGRICSVSFSRWSRRCRFDPSLEMDLAASELEDGAPGLPTSSTPGGREDADGEFRPFIRRLPEFKFW